MKREHTKVKKLKSRKMLWLVVGATVVIVSLGVLLFLQYKKINEMRDPAYAVRQAEKDAANLKERVGKLILLPEEEATIATVQNIDSLKSQNFFKRAENGDKVLIFAENKQAIIFREKDNKIINAGPIVLTKDLEETKDE